ncbi:MAG: hypothetical protein FWB72_03130 [Firmicutes bacterium]|nr:hypothetical protein [Bacillota bacterium]
METINLQENEEILFASKTALNVLIKTILLLAFTLTIFVISVALQIGVAFTIVTVVLVLASAVIFAIIARKFFTNYVVVTNQNVFLKTGNFKLLNTNFPIDDVVSVYVANPSKADSTKVGRSGNVNIYTTENVIFLNNFAHPLLIKKAIEGKINFDGDDNYASTESADFTEHNR